MRYGKLEPEYDENTIQFANYLDSTFHAPTKYDFDQGRLPIPISDWGSTKNACDVIASQANQLLRLGRIDQKRTIPLTSADVVRRYRRISGSKKVEDEKDIGVSVLAAMKDWKRGWRLHNKIYSLAMYGEIHPAERELVRTAIYVFRGIHFGLWLPKAVEGNFTAWHWQGENGEEWKPGGLGGVLGYCKAYSPAGYEILLGGHKIAVSNEFVEKYCDECWVATDVLDYWATQVLDMKSLFLARPSLMQYIAENGNKE